MIRTALQRATARLSGSSDSPRLDAEWLLAHLLGISRSQVMIRDEELLDEALAQRYEQTIDARARGVPVAYLIGYRDFWNSRFLVTPAVLIPRADTELLVDTALKWLAALQRPRVLDLGTGSGAIGLSVARERPDASVDLVDRSSDALAVAERNRLALDIQNVRLLEGSWFAPLHGQQYDLILSNPPYIAPTDPHLRDPALQHEPADALVAADDGLADLRTIATQAPSHLASGGRLLLEHGYEQGRRVRDILREAGFARIETLRDLGGRERATGGARGD
jgi:release factor glutamine methyltransferase